MDRISPELALVDGVLDETARRALPETSDCLAPAPPLRSAASVRPRPSDPARVRRLWLAPIAALGLTAAVALSPFGSVSTRRAVSQSPSTRAAPAVTRPVVAQTPSTPTLRWPAVPKAAFYNVILWRGSERALDLWPRAAHVEIPHGSLVRGTYQWFVYPAFGEGTTRRYGRVVARGQLRI